MSTIMLYNGPIYTLDPANPLDALVINASLIGHFKPLVTGSVFVSDAGYFVTGTLLALFFASRKLASRA